jgi:hypothetical protein
MYKENILGAKLTVQTLQAPPDSEKKPVKNHSFEINEVYYSNFNCIYSYF